MKRHEWVVGLISVLGTLRLWEGGSNGSPSVSSIGQVMKFLPYLIVGWWHTAKWM